MWGTPWDVVSTYPHNLIYIQLFTAPVPLTLPVRSQFTSQSPYRHTALHELAHATGHSSGLNRTTLNEHGGFGSEDYAREELQAEIAAMMAGETLGVAHEPRHGTAHVSSWNKAARERPAGDPCGRRRCAEDLRLAAGEGTDPHAG